MNRRRLVLGGIILGDIVGGYVTEGLRNYAIKRRTHQDLAEVEPWDESVSERLLLKLFIILAWWRILYWGYRRHDSTRRVLADCMSILVSPLNPEGLVRSYAGSN